MALCSSTYIRRGYGDFQLSSKDCSSGFYADIHPDPFFKVCSYLDLKEICKLGRVCKRWYHLTRSEYFWHRTDISRLNLTVQQLEKLIQNLPSCVAELRIGYHPSAERQPIWLPSLFHNLRERCPQLDVLIIENAILVKATKPYQMKWGYMLNCKVPEKEQVIRHFNEMEYSTSEKDTDLLSLYYQLQSLSTLSLRKSLFAVEDIFPSESVHFLPSNIRVLDATLSLSTTDKAISSFCKLPNLQELYLSGTAVTVNGVLTILGSLPSLRILDLDSTVIGGETFAALKDHGKSLVELYLGETAVKDEDLLSVDECSFPNLRKICLRRTRVTEVGVKNIVDFLRLKSVFLSQSCVSPGWIVDQRRSLRAKLQHDDSDEAVECDHFLANKNCEWK